MGALDGRGTPTISAEWRRGSIEPPASETTIAVVLGASEYPDKPAWSNPVLGASARAFRAYVLSPDGLGLAAEQVLDLFDSDAAPVDQLLQVQQFLQGIGKRAHDLLFYYVGHGGFDNDDYYLGIRGTRRDHEFITTIESRKLARIIRDAFGRKRVYVILDACFAASAARDWQGDEIDAAVRKMSQPLPRLGTAFLAAASRHDVTRAPRAGAHTVFTAALLEALARGVDRAQPRISMYELYEEVRDLLQRRESDEEARPELHVPSQREGDVSQLPLFPNAAYGCVVAGAAEGDAGDGADARARGSATRHADTGRPRVTVSSALKRGLVALVLGALFMLKPVFDALLVDRETSPATSAASVPLPLLGAAPALVVANTWVRVVPPAPPIVLGIDNENTPAEVAGFRPSRKIVSPAEPYDIHEHEVTWAEVEPWAAARGLELRNLPPTIWERATLPVTDLEWWLANDYCESIGALLPTEEQWEYAARGPRRRPNSWGADRLDRGDVRAYRGPTARPAAVKSSAQDQTPPPVIYDLVGNVQEWTLELWRPDAPGTDERWVHLPPTSIRAIRGLPLGRDPPPQLPSVGAAYREPLCATGPCVTRTEAELRHVGFRCARTSPEGAVAPR